VYNSLSNTCICYNQSLSPSSSVSDISARVNERWAGVTPVETFGDVGGGAEDDNEYVLD